MSGKVNKISIGRTITFTKPKNATPIKAASSLNPGTIVAVMTKEIAVATQVKTKYSMAYQLR